MAKEITGQIKLQIPAGQANPAPPVGPALGQQGVNIMAFCKEFNAATQKQAGDILPVVITVYKDKSFTFITKQPPSGVLLKKAAGIASGSKEPNKVKVAKLTKKQVMDLVKIKMKDMNAKSEEAAQLVQAVLNLIPTEPGYRAHEIRDLFASEWGRCYDEPLTKKDAWNKIRKAMRHGMLGRDENGLIYPRHG